MYAHLHVKTLPGSTENPAQANWQAPRCPPLPPQTIRLQTSLSAFTLENSGAVLTARTTAAMASSVAVRGRV
jgi:hypothetical protein